MGCVEYVVDAFHLQNSTEALLGITQRSHQGLAFLVDEIVDGRRVVDFVGILGAEGEIAIAQVDACSSGTHVFRDVVEHALVDLLLADETSSDAHFELGIVECCDALVQVPFCIHATHDAAIVVGGEIALQIRCPKITLAAIHAL